VEEKFSSQISSKKRNLHVCLQARRHPLHRSSHESTAHLLPPSHMGAISTNPEAILMVSIQCLPTRRHLRFVFPVYIPNHIDHVECISYPVDKLFSSKKNLGCVGRLRVHSQAISESDGVHEANQVEAGHGYL
jgi:hypothetical protein